MNLISPIRNNVQIATFGEDFEGIKIGLQNFPTSKLFLVCYYYDEAKAFEFSKRVADVLKIDSYCITLKRKFCFFEILEKIGQIVESESKSKILVNVSCGDKMITSATICASFLYGLNSFLAEQGELEILPPIKLSYNQIISDTKMKILKCLYENDDNIESLDRLSELSHLGKALVSYHIHGVDGEGLIEKGFVVVTMKNKLSIKLTDFGRLFVSHNNLLSNAKISCKEFKNKCCDCRCIPEECRMSGNERECPNCDLEKCCCWAKFAVSPVIQKQNLNC